MLTLVTGEPGNGKTALAVSMILEEMAKNPRPLFNWGVKELTIPHSPCPPLAQWTRQEPVPEDPSIYRSVFDFPSGSLIVIDECQDVFRVRAASSKVPNHVAALETHRHQGLEFILITQKPMQIDSNVRALIGKHIHIKSNWAGRKLFEWPECRNPASRTDCDEATTRKFVLPKQVFDLYKSATVHIKPTRRLPKMVYVLIVVVIVFVVLLFEIMGRMQKRLGTDEAMPQEAAAVALVTGPTKEGQAPVQPSAAPVAPVEYYLESFVYVAMGPRVITRKWAVTDGKTHHDIVQGHACVGEGTDAVCEYKGQKVRYRRSQPIAETRYARNDRVNEKAYQRDEKK